MKVDGRIEKREKECPKMKLYGEARKDFCPNMLQPLVENISRSSCNDGSRKLIPVFHGPHRNDRSFFPVMALTLEYLIGVLL